LRLPLHNAGLSRLPASLRLGIRWSLSYPLYLCSTNWVVLGRLSGCHLIRQAYVGS